MKTKRYENKICKLEMIRMLILDNLKYKHRIKNQILKSIEFLNGLI